MTENTQKPKPDPNTLLYLSTQFLRRRRFTDCRSYADQAHQLNPNLTGVPNILAITDVLLSITHQTPTDTVHNWYDVLQIPHYSQDNDLITKQFNHLYGLLHPSNNKFPLADEAFNVVCDAWHVLSDGLKKAEYDCFLKNIVQNERDNEHINEMGGFWTVCPYCYYVYEYARDYLDMCVKCVNDECGKAFTCVEIGCPPDEVLEIGKYVCDGFVMLGLRNGGWNPFVPVNNKRKPDEKLGLNGDETDKFVTISDDESLDEGVESKRDGCVNGDVEGVRKGVGVGRKKSAAKNTKKVTGAGNRVRIEAVVERGRSDECEYF